MLLNSTTGKRFSKHQIVIALSDSLSLRAAAEQLGCSRDELSSHIKFYQLDPFIAQLAENRVEQAKARTYADYLEVVKAFGHHPAVHELTSNGHISLYQRILRHWNSIGAFRAAYKIRRT